VKLTAVWSDLSFSKTYSSYTYHCCCARKRGVIERNSRAASSKGKAVPQSPQTPERVGLHLSFFDM
jgi:hypothetical protein